MNNKDVENASKIIEVKANIEKAPKKQNEKEEEIAQFKDESFGKGSQEKLLNHNVKSKQLEEFHTAELKQIDELHVAKIEVSSILHIIIFLS